MAAEDVSLGWDDLRSVIAERDETNVAADARADNSRRGAEGESQPLMQPWQEGMAVPAPPTPPRSSQSLWAAAASWHATNCHCQAQSHATKRGRG